MKEIEKIREHQERLEAILMQEIEKESARPASETGSNNIPELVRTLFELWKMQGLVF